jgi:hypothetical protein
MQIEKHNRTKFLVKKHMIDIAEQRRLEELKKLKTFWKRKVGSRV